MAESPCLTPAQARAYLVLARASLAARLDPAFEPLHGQGVRNPVPDTPFELPPWPGVFVTLWKQGRPRELRGCIGHITGRMPLSRAVMELALDAAFEDYRFSPLTPQEYPQVSLEITVLSPPVPVPGWQDIQIGRHGIFLECRGHKAVFLPQVPGEQGWNRDQTLQALCRKAGLPPETWRDPDCRFQVFEGFHAGEAD